MNFKQKLELVIVYLGMYCAAFTFTVVFPFASEMVMSFGVASNRDSTGFWVGLLATSIMVGRVVSSPIWGSLIDIWGRKVVTQFSLISMSVLQTLFGLCTSITPALIIRLSLGLLSPLMISSKTIAAELLKDNIADAMIWITITWNIGSISGSFFGGILSNPNSKGLTSGSFFEDRPFFLCCLLPSIICLITFALSSVYLRETLVKYEKGNLLSPNLRSIKEILLDPVVLPICVVYGILSFNATAFQELITLYCWAKRKSGGLELSSQQIGYILGISNFGLLFIQRNLFLFFSNKVGMLGLCKWGFFLLPFFSLSVPLSSLIENEDLCFAYMIFVCIFWYFADFSVCTAILVVMNHSVPNYELGKLNGATMSINCLLRALAPVTIGSLFAFTITNDNLHNPINYSICFYFLVIVQFLGLYFSLKISSSTQEAYKEATSEIPLVEMAED